MTFSRIALLFAVFFCCCGLAVAEMPLTIVTDSIPPLNAGEEFHVTLRATGGVGPYHWSVVDGEPPDGITLSHEGVLAGRPVKSGPFTLSIMVADSSHPALAVQKSFEAVVGAALLFEWLEPPKAHDNRIDGSVQVSNGTHDTFDLTVVIEAVASDSQRATAIGYERFNLKPGATDVRIKFGNTLPFGSYVIHADAVAEIAAKNSILRQRLQTPQPLNIVQGP